MLNLKCKRWGTSTLFATYLGAQKSTDGLREGIIFSWGSKVGYIDFCRAQGMVCE